MRVRSGPIPLSGMEVTVGTEHERYPTSRMSGTGLFISTGPQGHSKTYEGTLGVDVESGTGTKTK